MKLISDGMPIYLAYQKKKFRLSEDWIFEYLGYQFVVPKGYVCDMASIPQWIWFWQWGAWHIGAVCHDYIYEYGYIYKKNEDGSREKIVLTRCSADFLFYEVMLVVGVRKLTARLMYWAVRVFGARYWLHD